MKRRDLLKAIGLLGVAAAVPPVLSKKGWINPALAGVPQRELRNARAIVDAAINFVAPAALPTVINIFMYGGPSELAANLTNIAEINDKSQNKYTSVRGDILQAFDAVADTGQVTANGFWRNAGGTIMEELLTANQMTLYRTINRVVDDNKAHRESIFSAQTGGVAIMGSPGMGTTLAAVLRVKMASTFNNADLPPLLPFVTLEGDTVLYDQGDIEGLPLWLRAVSLDNAFNNPYKRAKNSPVVSGTTQMTCTVNGIAMDCTKALDNLVSLQTQAQQARYEKILSSFSKRKELDEYFSGSNGLNNPAAKVPATDSAGATITFSDSGFGATLRAATVLALENPDTRFITLSTGGLGGWDDHDNAIEKYEQRVQGLMSDIKAAIQLLNTGTTTGKPARTNVVINMYGEFGRNVNLNGSMGWDHGNNMNLYTFGGSGIPGRVLGQVIGQTKVIGTPGENRLFTSPADTSVQYEPFSIAATVYKYFGVQNPEILTADPAMAVTGFKAIDG